MDSCYQTDTVYALYPYTYREPQAHGYYKPYSCRLSVALVH